MDRNKGEKKLGVGEEGMVREAGKNCRMLPGSQACIQISEES